LHGAANQARRYRNDPKVERYLERSGSREIEVFEEALFAEELAREQLMLGLRTEEGASLSRLAALEDGRVLERRKPAIARAVARGELLQDDGSLRVPHARWLALDSIVAALF
jgi:coproporphyrinogen III oxidase-like Fe-S oxidoreductase